MLPVGREISGVISQGIQLQNALFVVFDTLTIKPSQTNSAQTKLNARVKLKPNATDDNLTVTLIN